MIISDSHTISIEQGNDLLSILRYIQDIPERKLDFDTVMEFEDIYPFSIESFYISNRLLKMIAIKTGKYMVLDEDGSESNDDNQYSECRFFFELEGIKFILRVLYEDEVEFNEYMLTADNPDSIAFAETKKIILSKSSGSKEQRLEPSLFKKLSEALDHELESVGKNQAEDPLPYRLGFQDAIKITKEYIKQLEQIDVKRLRNYAKSNTSHNQVDLWSMIRTATFWLLWIGAFAFIGLDQYSDHIFISLIAIILSLFGIYILCRAIGSKPD